MQTILVESIAKWFSSTYILAAAEQTLAVVVAILITESTIFTNATEIDTQAVNKYTTRTIEHELPSSMAGAVNELPSSMALP